MNNIRSVNINKIIIYTIMGLILTLFVSCSISLVRGITQPCATNDGYCWEGQSSKSQSFYLN